MKKQFTPALLIALVGTVLTYLLGGVVSNVILRVFMALGIGQNAILYMVLSLLATAVTNVVLLAVVHMGYSLLIAKETPDLAQILLPAAISGVVMTLVTRICATVLYAVLGALGLSYALLSMIGGVFSFLFGVVVSFVVIFLVHLLFAKKPEQK